MEPRCKNCKFWNNGECIRVDYSGELKESTGALFVIHTEVADDHGLSVVLRTSPEFGCIQFEGKAGSNNGNLR